jgi:hypothetical protein
MRVEQAPSNEEFNNSLSRDLDRQQQIQEEEAKRFREHKKEEARKKTGVPGDPAVAPKKG